VQGLVGSAHKVDVSYLSPHVNLTALLESQCAHLGVPWVFSGEVFDLLPAKWQRYCRHLDAVSFTLVTPARTPEASVVAASATARHSSWRSLDEPSDNPASVMRPVATRAKRVVRMDLFTIDVSAGGLALCQLGPVPSEATATATAKNQCDSDADDIRDRSPFSARSAAALAGQPSGQSSRLPVSSTDPAVMAAAVRRWAPTGGSVVVPTESSASTSAAVDAVIVDTIVPDNSDLIGALQHGLPESFVGHYNRATGLYIDGQWSEARVAYEACLVLAPTDRPTLTQLALLKRHDFRAPPHWGGYRVVE
jgi:hypothetical protein